MEAVLNKLTESFEHQLEINKGLQTQLDLHWEAIQELAKVADKQLNLIDELFKALAGATDDNMAEIRELQQHVKGLQSRE